MKISVKKSQSFSIYKVKSSKVSQPMDAWYVSTAWKT